MKSLLALSSMLILTVIAMTKKPLSALIARIGMILTLKVNAKRCLIYATPSLDWLVIHVTRGILSVRGIVLLLKAGIVWIRTVISMTGVEESA